MGAIKWSDRCFSLKNQKKKLKWKPKSEDSIAVLTEFMKNLDKSLA